MATPLEEKFELLEVLGEGSAGSVHRARLRATGEEVALKILHGTEASLPQTRERFAQEAKLLLGVRSPYVVRAVTAGAVDQRLYLAMEYLKASRDLHSFVREERPSVAEALDLVACLAAGLAEVHAHGIVHRDLKPANVLVARDGTPKLIDFGLAKSAAEGVKTATGIVLGTPGYMAPERLHQPDTTPAADIYSLGSTLFFTITRRELFPGDDLHTTLRDQQAGLPRRSLAKLSAKEAALVEWLCARTPADRPTAAEARDALEKGHAPGAPLRNRNAATLAVDSRSLPLQTAQLPRAEALSSLAVPLPSATGPSKSFGGTVVTALLLSLSLGFWAAAPAPAPPEPPPAPSVPTASEAFTDWAKAWLATSALELPLELRLAAEQAFPNESFYVAQKRPVVPEDQSAVARIWTVRSLLDPIKHSRTAKLLASQLAKVGTTRQWGRVLAKIPPPPPAAWWKARAYDQRQFRQKILRRLLTAHSIARGVRTLGGDVPERLQNAEQVLATVIDVRLPTASVPRENRGYLPPIKDQCWIFMNPHFAGAATTGIFAFAAKSPTPPGECTSWATSQTGFFTAVRPEGFSLVPKNGPIHVDDTLAVSGLAMYSPPSGGWIEFYLDVFDLYSSTLLNLRVTGADGRRHLSLPFHIPDQALTRRRFNDPMGLQDLVVEKAGPVRVRVRIARHLLPDEFGLEVRLLPLSAHMWGGIFADETTLTARAVLVGLGMRSIPAPP